MRGGVSLWAGARELCFRKGLLYGLMRCLSIPFKTLQGAGQSLGVTRLMCNVSCISTALQIELVSLSCNDGFNVITEMRSCILIVSGPLGSIR